MRVPGNLRAALSGRPAAVQQPAPAAAPCHAVGQACQAWPSGSTAVRCRAVLAQPRQAQSPRSQLPAPDSSHTHTHPSTPPPPHTPRRPPSLPWPAPTASSPPSCGARPCSPRAPCRSTPTSWPSRWVLPLCFCLCGLPAHFLAKPVAASLAACPSFCVLCLPPCLSSTSHEVSACLGGSSLGSLSGRAAGPPPARLLLCLLAHCSRALSCRSRSPWPCASTVLLQYAWCDWFTTPWPAHFLGAGGGQGLLSGWRRVGSSRRRRGHALSLAAAPPACGPRPQPVPTPTEWREPGISGPCCAALGRAAGAAPPEKHPARAAALSPAVTPGLKLGALRRGVPGKH